MKFFKKLIRNTQAATAIEYGLIAALIAVAGVTAFQTLGSQISNTMNEARDEMSNAN